MNPNITTSASLAGLLFAATLLAGCATPTRVVPLTVSDIVALSEADTPPEQIVDHIRESRAVYRLPASELARLQQQGVADEVIDTMQATHLEDERLRGIREGRDLYWWYDDFGGFNAIRLHRRHPRHRHR